MKENFDLDENSQEMADPGEVNMTVSPICHTESGDKYAYISFSDGLRSAEGRIPECKITDNHGFAALEIQQLEAYMQQNLSELKKTAASLSPFRAMLKEP